MTSCLWYRVQLRPDQIVAGHIEIIRRRFLRAIGRAETCAGACLFLTREAAAARPGAEAAADDSDDAGVVFFSPASISFVPRLLARYGGEPSEAPDRGRVVLLVGEEQDWELIPFATH